MLRNRFPLIIAQLEPRMDAAARMGAEAIQGRAKQRVPVETGALRDAIHVEHPDTGTYAVVAGDTDAWYGMLVEHGTKRNPPHPFLVPALEESVDEIVSVAQTALKTL